MPTWSRLIMYAGGDISSRVVWPLSALHHREDIELITPLDTLESWRHHNMETLSTLLDFRVENSIELQVITCSYFCIAPPFNIPEKSKTLGYGWI